MSKFAHSIHHVNYPSTDIERTKEWYGKVFHMTHVDVSHLTNTGVLLLKSPSLFELHFTPFAVEDKPLLSPMHYAVEVEDWAGFMAHLKDIKVSHSKPVERPQNNSKFCYITDPDGNMIELTWHGDREDLKQA